MSKINFRHNLIASNLRYLRERERIGRTRFARRLKISLQKIDRIERGEAIDVDTLIIYSDYFGIPVDRLIREDLSKSDITSNVTILEDNITISKDDRTITKNDTASKELSPQEVKALQCAKNNAFDCPNYEARLAKSELCNACFDATFWEKKEIARELYLDNEDTETEEISDYLTCEHFQRNPNPDCYFRNIRNLKWAKCQDCLHDIARWGEMAIGYKREVGK